MTFGSPQIAIVGAGLSGLTLGSCLRQKGIPAVIYERAASAPRYNYAISLHPHTYRPLLGILKLDETSFSQKVAIDASKEASNSSTANTQSKSLRCHRGRLEALLREGLSITWGKTFKTVDLNPKSQTIIAQFEDGQILETPCLIGCDGPHSMIRQSLDPSMQLEVLPYVVFNGKRRLSKSDFQESVETYMHEKTIIHCRSGNVVLEIAINNFAESHVDISYTYSRPANGSQDHLHKPNRAVSGAQDIPDEFFQELARLRGLDPPFNKIFHPEKVKQDRLLHWLMRSLDPDQQEADRLASHNIVLIGDAIHATPIIGGNGANIAIKDGIDLAEHIANHGLDSFGAFRQSKLAQWQESVFNSKARIRDIHSPHTSSL